ncbi:RHO1 GDP-GTP exchange protein 2 [Ceratobasidium sp. 395]|nr:RHO1 GDP-GTP exchange protein 2 [Ceratobasidium sp. 395]
MEGVISEGDQRKRQITTNEDHFTTRHSEHERYATAYESIFWLPDGVRSDSCALRPPGEPALDEVFDPYAHYPPRPHAHVRYSQQAPPLPAPIYGPSSKEGSIDHGFKKAGQSSVHSMPQKVVDAVTGQERKRQEAINEIIDIERDFVRDLEYLRDSWMTPLRTNDVIPPERRADFVQQVFWNVEDIIDINTRLRDLLTKRQKAYPIVETIGDIFLELVPHFGPFVQYGKHQLYGKYEFEKEKASNLAFSSFVETVERLPASRKLELNGYLTKPTTRLARYPLLLEVVLKHTPENSPDQVVILKALKIVREFLGKMNEESRKTENRFDLSWLDGGLVFKPGEEVDLTLKDEQRKLVYKGLLNRRGRAADENGDLQVFLFDHALLMVRSKVVDKHEQLKVFRRPIPLELLVFSAPEDRTLMRRDSYESDAANGKLPHAAPAPRGDGCQLTIGCLGKRGTGERYQPGRWTGQYSTTLWASTIASRRKWVAHITAQQEVIRKRSMVFDTFMLSEEVFAGEVMVNCAVPYDMGRRIAYGTDVGVFFQCLSEGRVWTPVKVLDLPNVRQIDVLEEHQLLIVLSGQKPRRSILTFPLNALESTDPKLSRKCMKRISSHTSFFKAGHCLGRTLVCTVDVSPLRSTIKMLEPIDQAAREKHKPMFKKLLQSENDAFKVFKASCPVLSLFRSLCRPSAHAYTRFIGSITICTMCVACTTGFEVVDIETLDTQSLLDPADTSLDFARGREDVRPLSIYRIGQEFLVCYTAVAEFAFYVDKSGRRSKQDVTIYWEGTPTAFALHHPYVMGFDPTFIEIRHVEDGSLAQVIRGNNLRCLFADTPPSVNNLPKYHQHTSSTPMHKFPEQSIHSSRLPLQRHGRDEIIFVSDSEVMAVRPATPPPSQCTSDASAPRV